MSDSGPVTVAEPPVVPPPSDGDPAHLGWRLLALIYDSLPVLAIWFAVAALMLALRAGQPVVPGSAAAWGLLLALWLATGGYAVQSWRKGGQTLGQRAWRLRVVGADGTPPSGARLWLRFALAGLSAAVFGLGFAWSLIDRQRRTWHELASATLTLRRPRRPT